MRVHIFDDPICIRNHDCTRGLLDRAREFTKGFLGSLALGYVFDNRNTIGKLPAYIAYRPRGKMAPNDAAVLADIALFVVEPVNLAGSQSPALKKIGGNIIGMRELLKQEAFH